jgi:hypothetical protein
MIEKDQIVEIDGDWNEDETLFTGTCEINYPNGERFKGEVESNIREGYGSYYYNNQDIYEGDWVLGRKQGKGKMTYANGTFYEGSWKKG